MKTISSIKKEMEFNRDLSVLVETLKSIAIADYYALEKKLTLYKEYLAVVESFFKFFDLENENHIFVRSRGQAQAVIAITTDAGFLGGVNMRVINAALVEAAKMPTTLIIVGDRGKMYVQGSVHAIVSFPGIQTNERFEQAMQLRDYVHAKALAGAYDTIKIIYPRPISFGVQRIETVGCIPFRPTEVRLTPPEVRANTIMESRPKEMIEYLMHLWMGETFYQIFGLSRLAEFGARYFHLEESSEKLKDENKKVKQEYFRVRHELIDRSMRELFSGRFIRGR